MVSFVDDGKRVVAGRYGLSDQGGCTSAGVDAWVPRHAPRGARHVALMFSLHHRIQTLRADRHTLVRCISSRNIRSYARYTLRRLAMHASPMDSPTSIRKTSPYEGPFQRGKRPDVVGVTFRQESTQSGRSDLQTEICMAAARFMVPARPAKRRSEQAHGVASTQGFNSGTRASL